MLFRVRTLFAEQFVNCCLALSGLSAILVAVTPNNAAALAAMVPILDANLERFLPNIVQNSEILELRGYKSASNAYLALANLNILLLSSCIAFTLSPWCRIYVQKQLNRMKLALSLTRQLEQTGELPKPHSWQLKATSHTILSAPLALALVALVFAFAANPLEGCDPRVEGTRCDFADDYAMTLAVSSLPLTMLMWLIPIYWGKYVLKLKPEAGFPKA